MSDCLCGECNGDGFDMFPCTKDEQPVRPYPEYQDATAEEIDVEEDEAA